MIYTVMGNSVKSTTKIESIKKFVLENFNNKGERLGFTRIQKEFAKWNDEKQEVDANTFITYKELQTACFLIADNANNGDLIPVLKSEDKENGVLYVLEKNDESMKAYSKNKARANTFDPTKLIIGLLGSDKYKFTADNIKSIQESLDLLK